MVEGSLFHHIGIATGDIEKTSELYRRSGHSITPIIHDSIQKVKICFARKEGSPLFELVSPLSEESPVTRVIINMGVTPYHVCYEISDITNGILQLKKKRFIQLMKPVPAIAFDNRLICFLFHIAFGLLELLQKSCLKI